MPRIDTLQRRVEEALHTLATMHDSGTLPPVLQPLLALAPPRGLRAEVTLHGDAGEHWNAGEGEVAIRYRESGELDADSDGRDVTADLIAVVADAERNPHLHFVALKFLRDRLLPQAGHGWVRSPHACQRAIADAIEHGVLRTSKKPNPRNPEFPVTAVELDHQHPAVVAHLAADDGRERGAQRQHVDRHHDQQDLDAAS